MVPRSFRPLDEGPFFMEDSYEICHCLFPIIWLSLLISLSLLFSKVKEKGDALSKSCKSIYYKKVRIKEEQKNGRKTEFCISRCE